MNREPSSSSTSSSTSLSLEEKKKRQLYIYAYHGFTETNDDNIKRWSVRRTRLPNIEIPEKDKHLFA
ncbi:unnamed protein product [Cunninghamella blakesleeana]